MKFDDYKYRTFCEESMEGYSYQIHIINGVDSPLNILSTNTTEKFVCAKIETGQTEIAPCGNVNYPNAEFRVYLTSLPAVLKRYSQCPTTVTMSLIPKQSDIARTDIVSYGPFTLTKVDYTSYTLDGTDTRYDVTLTCESQLYHDLTASYQKFKIDTYCDGTEAPEVLYESANTGSAYFIYDPYSDTEQYEHTHNIMITYMDQSDYTNVLGTEIVQVYDDGGDQAVLLAPRHFDRYIYYHTSNTDVPDTTEYKTNLAFLSSTMSAITLYYMPITGYIDDNIDPLYCKLTIGQYITYAYYRNRGVTDIPTLWHYIRQNPIAPNLDTYLQPLHILPTGSYDWSKDYGQQWKNTSLWQFLVGLSEYMFVDIYLKQVYVTSTLSYEEKIVFKNATLETQQVWDDGEYVTIDESNTDWVTAGCNACVDTLLYNDIARGIDQLESPNLADNAVGTELLLKTNLNNACYATGCLYAYIEDYDVSMVALGATQAHMISEYIMYHATQIKNNPIIMREYELKWNAYPCIEVGDMIYLKYNGDSTLYPIIYNGNTIETSGAFQETIDQHIRYDTVSAESTISTLNTTQSITTRRESSQNISSALTNYYTKNETDSAISTGDTNTLTIANAYTDTQISQIESGGNTPFAQNYRQQWYYADCISGNDNNDGKTASTAWQTLTPFLKMLNGMGQNTNVMPNIYLRGNASSGGTSRKYYWGDKTNSDVRLQGGVYCNQCLHIFFVGHDIELNWPGTTYLKKIYNGHINVQPRNGIWGVTDSTDNMTLTWSWDNDADNYVWDSSNYNHSWYFAFEHTNVTITGVNFTGTVSLNGCQGSFTRCQFWRLCGNYCNNLQFITSLSINATTSNLTENQMKSYSADYTTTPSTTGKSAVGNFCKYGNVDFRTCDNLLFRCIITYNTPATVGHSGEGHSAPVTLMFGTYGLLGKNSSGNAAWINPASSTTHYTHDMLLQSATVYACVPMKSVNTRSTTKVFPEILNTASDYRSQWICNDTNAYYPGDTINTSSSSTSAISGQLGWPAFYDNAGKYIDIWVTVPNRIDASVTSVTVNSIYAYVKGLKQDTSTYLCSYCAVDGNNYNVDWVTSSKGYTVTGEICNDRHTVRVHIAKSTAMSQAILGCPVNAFGNGYSFTFN